MQPDVAAKRPDLPHVSTVRTARRLGRVFYAVFFGVPGAFVLVGPWFSRDRTLALVLGAGLLGLLFLVVAALFVQEGFQVVTLSESGVEARGPLWTKRARWEDIGCVRVTAVSHDRRRTMAAAGAFGAIGGAIAKTMEGPERSVPELFGDPSSDRRGFTPTATLRGRDGRRLLGFSTVLEWTMYDALVAEAAGRGIEVRGS
jgi:hypothetical protein